MPDKKTVSDKKSSSSAMTGKRIAAIACIVILVAMYVITLLVAIFDHSASMRLFQACLVATIGLPILCWIYILCYGYYAKKHTIADLDLMQQPDVHESAAEAVNHAAESVNNAAESVTNAAESVNP